MLSINVFRACRLQLQNHLDQISSHIVWDQCEVKVLVTEVELQLRFLSHFLSSLIFFIFEKNLPATHLPHFFLFESAVSSY